MKEITSRDFDETKTYWYVDTKYGQFKSNDLTEVLLMWAEHWDKNPGYRARAIVVGRVG